MSEEIIGITGINDPKVNTAKVTTSTMDQKDLRVQGANLSVRNAGEKLKPFNTTYLGSAVVHYYVDNLSSDSSPTYHTTCQTLVTEVDEGLADFGWKRLQEALMKVFGRKVPKVRGAT